LTPSIDYGRLRHKGKYWLLIAAVLVLALHPLSFFMHIPKWDSVRGYLPYRFFISDYINDGHLPLWNPFQRLGYPGYSDLQSGCWYPIVWLLMLFGQYDITSLIVEVVCTFLIAGWGMFTLSNYVHGHRQTSFLLAISYALSGCMVGSAQLMVFLIGMAWLPWILWGWLKVLKGDGIRYAALLAFFLMCNITGASPAFTIVLMYVLPAIAFWHFMRSENKSSFVLSRGFQLLITATLLLLLLSPFIVAFIDFLPYFNRTGKLPYEAMIINPFVWSDYISFVFPYSVLSTHEMFQVTDLSLRNAYVGLAGLFFCGLTLFYWRNRGVWHAGLLIGVVLALWLALGDFSGIYRLTYHLPGFGLFRHPAFFRGYAILGILLLSGFSLRRWLEGEHNLSMNRLVFFLVSLVAVGLFAWYSTTSDLVLKTLQEIAHSGEFPAHGFASQLLVNCVIIILLIALVLLVRRFMSLTRFQSLVLFVVLDLLVQTRLSAPTTLYHSVEYSQTASFFETLESLPAHDQTANAVPMKLLDESNGLVSTPYLEKNISTYNRRVSSAGENPMRFRAFDHAKDSGLLQWVFENPLLYFPYRICADGDSVGEGCIFRKNIHLDNIGSECSLSQAQVSYNQYSAKAINPTEYDRWLILNANYHHLWSASYNGKQLPIERVNHVVMGVLIPPFSEGNVVFTFSSPALPWAMLLSLIGFAILFWLMSRKSSISGSQDA